MARLRPGVSVRAKAEVRSALRFAPPDADLTVVVHEAALRAPANRHTQVARLEGDSLIWLGALGEDLLESGSLPEHPGARSALDKHLLQGPRLWDVVRPGSLVVSGGPEPLSTIYAGSPLRPWIVIGDAGSHGLVAVPLNETSNPKWWTPVVPQNALHFPGNLKDAQVELAHAWTVPTHLRREGEVLSSARDGVEEAVRRYLMTEIEA